MKKQQIDECQILLHKILRYYIFYSIRQGKSIGVHPGQAVVLRALRQMNGCSQRALSDSIQVRPPTIAVTLRRMEESGWIVKKPNDRDRRISEIYLTTSGQEKAAQIERLFSDKAVQLFGKYNDQELLQIQATLAQLCADLEQTISSQKKREETNECLN